eukprot:9477416-Pyramimonas_sp.AAC.1
MHIGNKYVSLEIQRSVPITVVYTQPISATWVVAGARRLYTAENSGSVLVWESISGKSSVFEQREKDKPQITCLACVGESDLWAGTATGDLMVYSMTTAEITLKPWLAHKEGVFCMAEAKLGDGNDASQSV